MTFLEILAVITTLWCVWLSKQQNILAWPVGIVAVIAYFIVFFEVGLYADMSLQVLFFFQSLYGWYNWNKPKNDPLEVTSLDNVSFKIHLGMCLFCIVFQSIILRVFTNSTQPEWDSTIALLSLLANFYLIKKYIQSWYLWIIVDVLMVFLMINKGLYLSSGLYLILLILAINGLTKWRQDLKMV